MECGLFIIVQRAQIIQWLAVSWHIIKLQFQFQRGLECVTTATAYLSVIPAHRTAAALGARFLVLPGVYSYSTFNSRPDSTRGKRSRRGRASR